MMLRSLVPLTALALLCGCPPDTPPPAVPETKPAETKKPVEQSLVPEQARPKAIVPTTVRPTKDPHDHHGPPDFVTRGSGVFDDQGKRYFYGVGKAKGIANKMKAHLLADKAAKAELNNQLRAYNQRAIDVLGPSIRTKADNYAVAEVEKAEIVDHWIDHDGDSWHSLRRLDANRYAEGLWKHLELSEEVREKMGRP
jgi:hypothetical protein